MTASASQALSILRDTGQFKWYVVTFFLVILCMYGSELRQKNYSVVLAGLALWGTDFFNELWNALVFHFTQFAPVWGAPHDTAYLILIGLNVEITFMFLLMGLFATMLLPSDKKKKIFGLNNRVFFALLNSALCVCVEIILNLGGWLTWEYWWWQPSFPFVLFLIGYLPFFTVCYLVYDIESRKKQIIVTGSILAFDALCFIIFSPILHWI